MGGRGLQRHHIPPGRRHGKVQGGNLQFLELRHAGIGGELHLQSPDRLVADHEDEVVDGGPKGGLEILTVARRPDGELGRDGGRGEVRAGQGPPVGGFQALEVELEGGVRKTRTRLGPGQGHGLIEASHHQRTPGLGDVHRELFHPGGLVGLVHRGLVFGDDLQFRSLAAGWGGQAQVGHREASLRGDDLALLEQIDPALGADGRAAQVVGQQRSGKLQDPAIDAGDLITDLRLLLGRIEGSAQGDRAEGLTALLEGQLQLPQFRGRGLEGQARGESLGLLERARRRDDLGA